jgi:hypothetical protein
VEILNVIKERPGNRLGTNSETGGNIQCNKIETRASSRSHSMLIPKNSGSLLKFL